MSILHHLFYWLGKLTGTLIIIPHPVTIGNCGEDIYYGLLKARRDKKKLVILFPYELPGYLRLRIPNREMILLESEYRTFLPSNPLYPLCCFLITLYFGFFRGVSLVTERNFKYRLPEAHIIPMIGQQLLWMPKPVMHDFSWDLVDRDRWAEQTETPLEISLSRPKLELAERMRREMGMPPDAWFVCLHVREGGYHNDHGTVERNADINNYIPAIKEITRRGGWVVRMGDATMKRLPPMERLIDYPFTPQKGELMDVYLLSRCGTYIGMQSGIFDVAMMFQRPIILTNMYSWFLGYPQRKSDLGILKRVYSKRLGRFLRPMEWPLAPWSNQTFDPREEYEFHENTPEQLLAVIKEFFDRPANWEPSALQVEFNALRLARARELISQPLRTDLPREVDVYDRYRLAARLPPAQGMLSASFLEASEAAGQVSPEATLAETGT